MNTGTIEWNEKCSRSSCKPSVTGIVPWMKNLEPRDQRFHNGSPDGELGKLIRFGGMERHSHSQILKFTQLSSVPTDEVVNAQRI